MQSRTIRQFVLATTLAVGLVGLAAAPAAAIAPTAFDGTLKVAKNEATAVDLTGSVSDPDGGTRTFQILTPPAHGDLSNACTNGLCSYTPDTGYVGPDSFTWKVSDGSAFSNNATVTITVADEKGAAIISAGPLSKVQTSPTLNCSVDRAGEAFGAFDQDIACGTLAVVDGTLYGPATLPGAPAFTAFTPSSQSAVTGDGSVGNPFKLVTTVNAGGTGVQLIQTDTYVIGQESYRTDVAVKNNATPRSVTLYRAGDCRLGEVDANGTGSTAPAGSGAVACTKGTRIQQFLPITAGSHYYEALYSDVWAKVVAQQQFPDTCTPCASTIDNGAGLSWSVALNASQTRTVSSMFTHSATGVMPLRTAVGVNPTSVQGGADVTYTVTVSNPGTTAGTVTGIVDTLAPGFTYVAGSTTGATTSEPSVNGSTLTWSLANPVVNAGGTLTLSFDAKTPAASSTSTNDATATATNRAVASSGPSASLTVTAPNTAPVAVDDNLDATTAQQASVNVVANDTDADGDPRTVVNNSWTQGEHGSVSCTSTTCSYTSVADYVGPDSFSYTVSDGKGGTDVGTVNVTVAAVPPPNRAPNAGNDSGSTPQGQPVQVSVLTNDSDPDGDAIAVTAKTNGAHGTVTCTVSVCTYDPADDYTGPDTFTYTISDGELTDTATVSITVTASADLAVTATSVASVPVGNLVGIRVTVRNNGGVASSPYKLKSVLPAGFRLRNTTGCSTLASTGCSLPGLAPGGTVSYDVYGALTRAGANRVRFELSVFTDPTPGNNAFDRYVTATGSTCTRIGTFGNDGLVGGSGREVFCGLAGNDVISPGLGNDVVYGNEGSDLVIYSSVARAVNINLATRRVTGQGTDLLTSIEKATGSSRNDVITGNGLANVLNGGAGADVINGGGGNDRIIGGAGNDRINGGAGKDVCSQGPGRGSVVSC